MGERIRIAKLFYGDSIALSANLSSGVIDLRNLLLEGNFAIHVTIGGTGTATIQYTVCPTEDGTFVVPGAAADIVTAMAAGTDYIDFDPIVTPFMKIKVTEAGGANPITVTLHLVYK